jgi:hypothetical protein
MKPHGWIPHRALPLTLGSLPCIGLWTTRNTNTFTSSVKMLIRKAQSFPQPQMVSDV